MPQFVAIEEHRDLPLAELSKIKLESEGVYCHLTSAFHIGLDWLSSQALGGVKVYVLEAEKEKAKKILAADESSYLDELENAFPKPEKDDMCQKCGSLNISYHNRARFYAAWTILITKFLPLIPLFIFGIRYKCKDCGFKMKPIKN